MKHSVLEVCADCVQSAVNADNAGADRIELCSNLVIGGVTPGKALFKLVKKYTGVKIRVLLRPRYGDYCYNAYEFEQLKEEVQMYHELGADGVVIGILRPDGRLDEERMFELIKIAGNMDTALHRAFDACVNPMETMEQAVSLEMKTILTGGQCGNAWNGRELLKELYEKSAGRIEILAAGGINAEVIENLIPLTGIASYHMSGKVVVDSIMTYRKAEMSMGLPERDEYALWQTSEEKVKQAVQVLKNVQNK
ncbi:MAG TPA: copper homeostasis protein CutC [Lachnoclostridium sp.]|jgi:copper homeostasis protein|uniref:copper homeostasis protein CutC n=1 Tax=Lacrimispora sp. TaxID=2719234 RepID=UPI000ECE9DCC|nr:copper homeostasis protein CutC [Lacrimispora sp.]HCD42237.1 copper homeostasis protein CutC [Lachnoclostridium sp.]